MPVMCNKLCIAQIPSWSTMLVWSGPRLLRKILLDLNTFKSLELVEKEKLHILYIIVFETLLKDPEVSKFIINYRKIDSNNKFCRGNILGINVDRDKNIISEKFYFTTSFFLSKQQALQFLPTEEDLLNVYRFADFSDNPVCKRGVTFAIKKTNSGLVRQFHFKVPSIFYSSPAMAKHKTVFLPERIFTGDEIIGIS